MYRALQASVASGGPAYHLANYTVMDNPYQAIHGGWQVGGRGGSFSPTAVHAALWQCFAHTKCLCGLPWMRLSISNCSVQAVCGAAGLRPPCYLQRQYEWQLDSRWQWYCFEQL